MEPHIDRARIRKDLLDTVTVVDVTPEMAEKWIIHNVHNRNSKARSIDRFSYDMENDAWQWPGGTICFSSDGTLLDGQNRLLAVVRSGKTVPFVVVTDLSMVAQRDIDTGVSRKLPDVLTLEGETNSTILAGIIRGCAGWEVGLRSNILGTAATGSISANLKFLSEHPELRDITDWAKATARGSPVPPTLIGITYWIFARIDEEDAEHFFARLQDGQNLQKGNAIYELRRTLTERGMKPNTNINRLWVLAIVIKAWNAYRDGAEVGHFRWSRGGAHPESFPEPR